MDTNEDQDGDQIEVADVPQEEGSEDESFDELMEPEQEIEESPTPSEPDEDAQHFDIALAAEHTYMGDSFTRMGSKAVVEGGQSLAVPALAAASIVFPGELVPLRLPRAAADLFLQQPDKLLVLLVPDETSGGVSGYGTLCEVLEASPPEEAGLGAGLGEGEGQAVCVKARARHRVVVHAAQARGESPRALRFYDSPRMTRVTVLPEGGARCPLRAAASPDMLRLLHAADHTALTHRSGLARARRRAVCGHVAAGTPWPSFLYEAFSLARLRNKLVKHFQHHNLAPLPGGCVALSSWACANVSLTYSQRLTLLKEDSAMARIALVLRMLAQKSRMLYCVTCGSALANRSDEIAMTTAGVHGHYANPGGYTHDVVTVRHGSGLVLAGASSAEYSWFPGYTWRVALCALCRHHKGWRFDAVSRRLVPRRFFALCRNHVTPHPPAPPAARPPHPLHIAPW